MHELMNCAHIILKDWKKYCRPFNVARLQITAACQLKPKTLFSN